MSTTVKNGISEVLVEHRFRFDCRLRPYLHGGRVPRLTGLPG